MTHRLHSHEGGKFIQIFSKILIAEEVIVAAVDKDSLEYPIIQYNYTDD